MSFAPKTRPARIGTPSTAKKFGSMTRRCDSCFEALCDVVSSPSRIIELLLELSSNGTELAPVTAVTPGTPATRAAMLPSTAGFSAT